MKYYVVDAFTDKLFKGNPAGVCLLEHELSDEIMQKIAYENNLAETAFLLQKNNEYILKWFTPKVEIDLCGHATLATAFVLMNYIDENISKIDFLTQSGILTITRKNDIYTMDFPRRTPKPCEITDLLKKALKVNVLETHISRDLLVLLEDEKTVANLRPDFTLLKKIPNAFGVIITAIGSDCDFVSRFFAPNAGIMEDSVTGSSHCSLIPYWSERLKKAKMTARQLSDRGGYLFCEDFNDQVKIGGKAKCYMVGEILV